MAVPQPQTTAQQQSGLNASPSKSKISSGNAVPEDNTPPSATTTQTVANQTNANTADPSNGFVKPQPNVLDSFASTTWSASVYLLSPFYYKLLVTGEESTIPGEYLLFQTAGAGAQGAKIGGGVAASTNADGSFKVDVSGLSGDRNAFFTEDSNNVVPTQRAIKTYLANRLSIGGADFVTGAVTAGQIKVGPTGFTNILGLKIRFPGAVNFKGPKAGVTGYMLAQALFYKSFTQD